MSDLDEYMFPLRRDTMVFLSLPSDLTVNDVERLHQWLLTLPVAESERPPDIIDAMSATIQRKISVLKRGRPPTVMQHAKAIQEAIAEGQSVREIAAKFQCHRNTIYRIAGRRP